MARCFDTRKFPLVRLVLYLCSFTETCMPVAYFVDGNIIYYICMEVACCLSMKLRNSLESGPRAIKEVKSFSTSPKCKRVPTMCTQAAQNGLECICWQGVSLNLRFQGKNLRLLLALALPRAVSAHVPAPKGNVPKRGDGTKPQPVYNPDVAREWKYSRLSGPGSWRPSLPTRRCQR